jgi:hypothetical protein
MKNLFHFIKRLIQNLLTSAFVLAIVFGFLSLCNWSIDLNKWTGFSRFVLGLAGVVMVVATYDAMVSTVRNFNRNIKQSETIA